MLYINIQSWRKIVSEVDFGVNSDMEENNTGGRPSALRSSGIYRSNSGKSSPRSPAFRTLGSVRNSRRTGVFIAQRIRSNRILLWLLLITLWTYGGFYVQTMWAHRDNKDGVKESEQSGTKSEFGLNDRRHLTTNNETFATKTAVYKNLSNSDQLTSLSIKEKGDDSKIGVMPLRKRVKKSSLGKSRKSRGKQKKVVRIHKSEVDLQEDQIPMLNSTYGRLVGPFGIIEDRILEWNPEKQIGTCERNGQFGKLVWSRKFVLIFHELSMTGAPLAMMELATELLNCGASVSVVALSKKGGLMQELARRNIEVLEDKLDISFKIAAQADMIIAGSAVCASWIEKYRQQTVLGASQIAWWIMENRREYFDRAKLALIHVKKVMFLSESQSRNWLGWMDEENIKIKSEPALIPLSVNDELAFVAGIASSLNTPAFTVEKMMERRELLRNSVRKEMGLSDNDMLVISLSSINPGKGQFLFLESARIMIEEELPLTGSVTKASLDMNRNHHSRTLFQKGLQSSVPYTSPIEHRKPGRIVGLHHFMTPYNGDNARKVLSQTRGIQHQKLKILIGSVGSKSNKVPYVKTLLDLLSQHSNLSQTVLWTPATTRVASLYSAADVYVMNAQGLGETFGRVTIEAMSFGLPVLGTDAGGTKEIVEHNKTGLLHPLGRRGAVVLAKNLHYLLENPHARQQMGIEGRKKVEKLYLKTHMYRKFGEVLFNCLTNNIAHATVTRTHSLPQLI